MTWMSSDKAATPNRFCKCGLTVYTNFSTTGVGST